MNLSLARHAPTTPEAWLSGGRNQSSRGCGWCGACAVAAVLVLFAVGFGGMWVVAKTGLVGMPSFFNAAIGRPTPTRVVVPNAGAPEALMAEFLKPDGTISGRLSEGALTSLLQSSLRQGGQGWIVSDQAQVVMDKEKGLELFIPIKNGAQETVFQARLLPQMVDGSLLLKIQGAQIGTLPIPFLSSFEPAIQEKLNAALNEHKDAFRLTRLEIGDGFADIAGSLLKPL